MAEKETNPPCHNPESEFRAVSLNRLKVISKDVEQRRTVLGKSWDELQIALSQYHASLVVRQEQFELQCDDSNTYITKLENELERRATENEHLQTRLDDVQEKCKALREENVVLRTAHEQVQNQVKIKENLIVKIQNQMSKESLEFSAEISALKESLDAMSETPRKRPRLDEVSIQKTDVSTKDAAQSDDAPPTFSIATMPHLALPTTSSEALETQNDVAYPSYDSASNLAPPEISHQVIQVPPLTQEEIDNASKLTFTVKQEIVDVDDHDHDTKSTSSSVLEDDAYVYNKPTTTADSGVNVDDGLHGNHGGNHSDDGNQSDSSLSNLDQLVSMSRPVGAPQLENSLDNDLAPIQIEKFRLPTGVIAMAPALNAAPPKMHHCPYCYRFFDKSISLREHLKIHLGTHMYECELCSRKFTQKGNLERHQRAVHKDEKQLEPKKHYRKRKQKYSVDDQE